MTADVVLSAIIAVSLVATLAVMAAILVAARETHRRWTRGDADGLD